MGKEIILLAFHDQLNRLMTSGSSDLDLSTERDVRAYLENTPFKSQDVIPLSGGTANYVFRLKLVTPYLGRETLVLKHAKPYVKNYHAIALDLDRQVSRLVPGVVHL